MRNNNLTALQSLTYIFLLLCIVNADTTSCKTQDNRPGQCILLEQCGPLLRMKNARPYTSKEETYLKKAICDYQDEIYAKVCCPVKPESRSTVITKYGEVDVVGPTTSEYLPDADICGPTNQYRIRGGNSTELGEYPWMALLEYETPQGNRFSCGGALINNRYVLTAAHCVVGKKLPRGWTLSSVRLGEYNLTSEEDCIDSEEGPLCSVAQDFKIEEKIVYEKYESTTTAQYHDIALLRLDRNVTYSDFIRPICIPTTADLLSRTYTDIEMTVAGWGATENSTQSDVMLQLRITVASNNDCASIYRSRLNIGVGQLCAGGEEGRDSCRGDSGGPLMVVDITAKGVNYYVAGIVSFGPVNCGLDKWPGVYTKLSKYVPWIVSQLKP